MGNYLINFIVNLNPNNSTGVLVNGSISGTLQWPEYTMSTGQYMSFGNGSVNDVSLSLITEPFGTSCDIWDDYVPYIAS